MISSFNRINKIAARIFFTIMVLCLSNNLFAQENTSSAQVDIKQMLQSQISKAKVDAGNNKNAAATATAPVVAAASTEKESNKKVDNTKPLSAAVGVSGITDDIFMKLFILVDLSLAAAVFLFWRRRNLKIAKAKKSNLKKNIIMLRQEQVGKKSDSVLDNTRKKLRTDPELNLIICNKNFVKSAKKMSVSVGELELAARIKSYQRESA